MKRIFSALAVALIASIAFSQTLEEDKEDEFTGTSMKRTSWEILTQNMKFSSFIRVSKLDSLLFLEMKMMKGNVSVFAIGKDDELMLKLENGEVVRLANLEFTTTRKGCGARGFSGSSAQGGRVMYPISKEQKSQLLASPVDEIRVYTTKGYMENDVKAKNASWISNSIELVE